MQIKVARNQKKAGIFGNKLVYQIDIRAEYSPEEKDRINGSKMGGFILFTTTDKDTTLVQHVGGLHVTVASLARGHHIESQSLAHLTEAENEIMEALKKLKTHLEVHNDFKGGEEVIEF